MSEMNLAKVSVPAMTVVSAIAVLAMAFVTWVNSDLDDFDIRIKEMELQSATLEARYNATTLSLVEKIDRLAELQTAGAEQRGKIESRLHRIEIITGNEQ